MAEPQGPLNLKLAELNQAIRELLEEFNNRPMQKLGVSRRELFEETERPALKPLPATRYEIMIQGNTNTSARLRYSLRSS